MPALVYRLLRATLAKLDIKDWVGEKAEVFVEVMRLVRDYGGWITQMRVQPQGGLLLDATGIHCFIFMRRKGAPHMIYIYVFLLCAQLAKGYTRQCVLPKHEPV